MKAERYIVLAGSNYYPAGWEDFKYTTDDYEQAESYGLGFLQGTGSCSWFQIVDLDTMTMVLEVKN